MGFIRPLLIIFLTIRFGGCPEPPRMVRTFEFDGTKEETLDTCKSIILGLDYDLDILAPETFLLVTVPKRLGRTLRHYDYSVVIYVTDRIQVYIAAERSIFKRGSELSIGGEGLVEKQREDTLPLVLQEKVFSPIFDQFLAQGFKPLQSG